LLLLQAAKPAAGAGGQRRKKGQKLGLQDLAKLDTTLTAAAAAAPGPSPYGDDAAAAAAAAAAIAGHSVSVLRIRWAISWMFVLGGPGIGHEHGTSMHVQHWLACSSTAASLRT
jgi:hypothetical protein